MGFYAEMTETDRYTACLEAMYGLRRFGIKLGLETIQGILLSLGNPQDHYKVVHVAGTNGKGSVASALAGILHDAGYKVGLYTSPHLVRFNERICIDNQPIADADVVRAYEQVHQIPKGDREPTFFEFATAMALYEFGRQNVDWAVIETGMGGRLDATNVVRPELTVITNISLEHQEYLRRDHPADRCGKGRHHQTRDSRRHRRRPGRTPLPPSNRLPPPIPRRCIG